MTPNEHAQREKQLDSWVRRLLCSYSDTKDRNFRKIVDAFFSLRAKIDDAKTIQEKLEIGDVHGMLKIVNDV